MSPAKNQLDPDGLRGKIRAWLAANPGGHRPAEVCDGLADQWDGMPRKRWMSKVGGELSRMALSGDLTRTQEPHASGEPGRRPVTYYSLADADQ